MFLGESDHKCAASNESDFEIDFIDLKTNKSIYAL
jgi:hypothetical protein